MKFLVPNYSCLQNPWLVGCRPQIPVLSVLCPQLNLLNPPPEQNFLVRHCRQRTCNVTRCPVGVTIDAVDNKYYIFWMCNRIIALVTRQAKRMCLLYSGPSGSNDCSQLSLSTTYKLRTEEFPAEMLRAGDECVKPSCIHLCAPWWLASEAWNMQGLLFNNIIIVLITLSAFVGLNCSNISA